MPDEHGRIFIREAAELLNRRIGTIRKWEALGHLPEHLIPKRGPRNWRYWNMDQIEGIKDWIIETERFPGKGLPTYDPDSEKVNSAIESMRKPRSIHEGFPS